ncbi:MAG: hypothetical protein ABIP79_16540 [Chitinophagaceae bacterium]
MTLTVEDNIPFSKKNGRPPSSTEYQIGSDIYEKLQTGQSVFINGEGGISEDKLRVRLFRLGGEGCFSVQVEELGFRVFRLK